MSAVLIEVRGAKVSDAVAIADTHGEAWRAAYRGIIPGVELEPVWWKSALCKGSRVALLAFGDQIAGYATYGPNRARRLSYDGETYQLYLRPEFQGLGFGRRLFVAAARSRPERLEEPRRVGAVGQRLGA